MSCRPGISLEQIGLTATHGERKVIWRRFGVWLLSDSVSLAADTIGSVVSPTWQEHRRAGCERSPRTFLYHFLERDLEQAEKSGEPRSGRSRGATTDRAALSRQNERCEIEGPRHGRDTDSLRHQSGRRLSGPLTLRLFLQPAVATFFAVRDGLQDARMERPPHFWRMVTGPPEARRGCRAKETWKAVLKVFVMAVVRTRVPVAQSSDGSTPLRPWSRPLSSPSCHVLLRRVVNCIAQRVDRAKEEMRGVVDPGQLKATYTKYPPPPVFCSAPPGHRRQECGGMMHMHRPRVLLAEDSMPETGGCYCVGRGW